MYVQETVFRGGREKTLSNSPPLDGQKQNPLKKVEGIEGETNEVRNERGGNRS